MEVRDVMALGKAIRRHRKFMGLTQQDAAGLCGVGERFLSELERGKESASLGKALQVIKRLGMRVILTNHKQMTKNVNDHA
jgi:y4mF family transcriptional regulator